MNYSYMTLVDNDTRWNEGAACAISETVLCEMGMEHCFSSGSVKLFISKQTPTLLIPERGVIIGHLFSRDGQPVTDGRRFAQSTSYTALEKILLNEYWGEYLLLYYSLEEKEQGLKILRDPSGGVPCVYSLQAGVGFITSNLSMAIRLNLYNKQIDWDYIAHVMVCKYLRTPRTGFSGVSELLPGCSLNLNGTGVTVHVSWSPWDFVMVDHRHSDLDEAAAEIRRAVSMVVKSLAETDGAMMLELSGGLDSSIVAACLRGVQARVSCCTLVTEMPGGDERQYARQMTDYLDVELQVAHNTVENACFSYTLSPDEVFSNTGMLYHANNKAIEAVANSQGVASVFSGSGGDAIFCYLTNTAPVVDAFKECGLAAGIVAIQNLSVLTQSTLWKIGRLTLRRLMRGPIPPWRVNSLFISSSKAARPILNHPWLDAPVDALPGDWEKIYGLIAMQSCRSIPPWGDGRLERAPLVSQPVVEACLKVPSWMCIAGGQNRSAARAAFADVLPTRILNRQGKGDFINYCTAAYRKNKTQIRDLLLTGHLQSQNFLDVEALEQFFKKDTLPSEDLSFTRISDLCMVENWLRNQIDVAPQK
jgi:asparagine synthase (glutamine-hydrolysing)